MFYNVNYGDHIAVFEDLQEAVNFAASLARKNIRGIKITPTNRNLRVFTEYSVSGMDEDGENLLCESSHVRVIGYPVDFHEYKEGRSWMAFEPYLKRCGNEG